MKTTDNECAVPFKDSDSDSVFFLVHLITINQD